MGLDLPFEGIPFFSIFAAIEKGFGAIFKAEVFSVGVANAFPFAVTDDAANGNVMLLHQLSDELGGAGFGGGEGAVAVFAHFDADGVSITASFIVGVLTLFVSGETLINFLGVDTEVPSEVAEGVVFGLEASAAENLGMSASPSTGAVALSGVDGDITW